MKGKKGTELTMNTVIIAAILIITMVVIIAIYLGGIGKVTAFWNKMFANANDDADCLVTFKGPDDQKVSNGLHDTKKKANGEYCDCEANECTTTNPEG